MGALPPVKTSSLDRPHFPSLDGLRGVSILLVLVGHASHTKGCPPWLAPVSPVSTLGVGIFFVLSGYLITTLLVQEGSLRDRRLGEEAALVPPMLS